MDNRLFRRLTSGAYLPDEPRRSTPDSSGAIRATHTDMNRSTTLSAKFNEKDVMRGLNDRLAGFIENVHHLEVQNHLLERDIEEIRSKAKPAACLEEEYGPELGRLRLLVQEISQQKHQIETEHANLEDELSDLTRRREREARSRCDAESDIVCLKKDISDAYLAKLQLDKKAQALVDEIHFLKANHEAEKSEMFDQIQSAQVTVSAHEFGNPDVTAALRDIRAQLEGHVASDFQHAGETLRSQFARLTEEAETKREALKATQQEIQEYRRHLQAKNVELDCAKGTREALEKQLHEVEDRHKEEMIHYQNTIKDLENELINCKFDMSGYLREYQDLLNVKMALDVEILSYRKLLCGEEARLSSMPDTHVSLPYIYHQSPVYTLPRLSRPGGPHRRAEPQYKFVEEIITETTREIEMSEFEETGSEETEEGEDERERSKRDRGSSEEEEGHEDGREEDGEPDSDSEQNQVENSVSAESSPKRTKDSDESDAEKNTQSDEEENEQRQKVTDKANAGKETSQTDQKDSSSKADELKSGVPVEKEEEEEEEEEEEVEKSPGKKGDAAKDIFTSPQVKETVNVISAQVSKETGATQELSSVGKVELETAETSRDLTAETKDVMSVETEELPAKVQGTESDHTEPEKIGKAEATKGEDKVAEHIQDAEPHGYKDQEKEPSLKSNAKQLPEVGDPKPNSADEAQVLSELPKEMTTANAAITEFHQGAAESSQVQKSKLSAVPDKTNGPQETEKVLQ